MKKALSPIITTILLVLLAIILALIIFLWARSTLTESLLKFDPSSSQDRPIEEICSSVSFDVSIDSQISIVNTGNIPIKKFSLVLSSAFGGSKIKELDDADLSPGTSKTFELPSDVSIDKISAIVPILLTKNDKGELKEYSCIKNSKEV